MSFIGNLLWIILGGLIAAILWLTVGLLLCVTIIGIPLGIQCFKMAGLSLAPFGKMVDTDFDEHPIANIIWAIVAGWEMCLMYLTVGVILCLLSLEYRLENNGSKWQDLHYFHLEPILDNKIIEYVKMGHC